MPVATRSLLTFPKPYHAALSAELNVKPCIKETGTLWGVMSAFRATMQIGSLSATKNSERSQTMLMKIDRRPPTSLYRKRPKWRLRDNVPIRAVVKYAALALIGFLLFRVGQAHALVERGYEALGGEGFALFLPVFYWMVARVVRDTIDCMK